MVSVKFSMHLSNLANCSLLLLPLGAWAAKSFKLVTISSIFNSRAEQVSALLLSASFGASNFAASVVVVVVVVLGVYSESDAEFRGIEV